MDQGYTDALWIAGFRRIGIVLREARCLYEQYDRYMEEREQVYDYDPNSNTGSAGITAAGVVYGSNCTEDGSAYVRITGSAGLRTVSWYKATGGAAGNLVAQGTAADGAVATMVAQNSSGLTGTYPVAASPTNEADDAHYLRFYLDKRLDGSRIFDGTDAEDDDSRSLQAWHDYCNSVGARILSRINELGRTAARLWVSDPANNNARSWLAEFLNSAVSTVYNETGTEVDGAVTQFVSGILAELKLSMEDETTGSTQTIVRRVVAATAGVAGTNNDGLGAIASHTPLAQCRIGVFRIYCDQGANDDVVPEEFRVSFASSEDDDAYDLPDVLTVGKSYVGAGGFGGATGITLVRTLSKTGDDTHLEVSDVTDGSWSVSGESLTHSDGGVLYGKSVASGANWIVRLYSTSNRLDGDLVAESAAAAADATFVATSRNSSGLQVAGTVGSGPTNDNTYSIDLNMFQSQNSSYVPDEFRVTTSLTSEGFGAKYLARLFGARLSQAADGAETIDDAILGEANTWEPYSVVDN